MSDHVFCCKDTLSAENAHSPFSRIIAFDYYDGPTSGVIQCKQCLDAYKFEMLAWDEGQDVRVFSLALLPSHTFTRLMKALAPLGSPSWPVWVPVWEYQTDSLREAVEQEVQYLLNEADSPQYVIAAQDLLNTLLRFKEISQENYPIGQNWFDLLHIISYPN